MATITTDDQLTEEVGKLAAGEQGGVPEVKPVLQTVTEGTTQPTQGTLLDTDPLASTTLADTTNLQVTPPTQKTENLGQVDKIKEITPNIGEMKTAQITDPKGVITDVPQGEVSEGAMAVAQTEELDPKATVQYQLGELMASIEDGKPLPAWASPAVRKVSAVMQARGMGASSMAAAAMTQAVMESGINIAVQDANKYATIQLQNLNNKQ